MQTTIIHNDVILDVDYTYNKPEPQTEWYPGFQEQVLFSSIMYKGVNVWEIYYQNNLISALVDLILEQREKEKREFYLSKIKIKWKLN